MRYDLSMGSNFQPRQEKRASAIREIKQLGKGSKRAILQTKNRTLETGVTLWCHLFY